MSPSPKNLFNHAEALAIMRIFGGAYKCGVRDAEWVNDPGRCKEHIAATQQIGVYGRVTEHEKDDWKQWKHRLLILGDKRIANSRCVLVISRITRWFNIEGCMLPLAQDFYNQGLKDWNEHPISRNITPIDDARFPVWTKNGIKSRTLNQVWVDVQTYAIEHYEQYNDADSARSLTPRKFELFSMGVWRALQDRSERRHILKHGR